MTTIPDPQERDPGAVLAMVSAYRLAQVVYACAALGIADALTGGGRTVAELAVAVDAHEPSLARLLRALAWHGLLLEDDGRYVLSALGSCLRTDDPSGARQMVLGWSGLPETYRAFGELESSVRTGLSGVELAFGAPFYEYMALHPDRAAPYEAAMESTVDGFQAAVESHDFSGYRHVVDVGGGKGAFLVCLLRAYPQLTATLFDVPRVVEAAVLPEDVADRIGVIAGDALQAVPSGGDAYVLSTVARCFDDTTCVQLLGSLRSAAGHEASVLLLEMIVPDEPVPVHALADLQAFMVYGGADRTRDEWRGLMEAAGFELRAIEPADGPFSWIVAGPSGD